MPGKLNGKESLPVTNISSRKTTSFKILSRRGEESRVEKERREEMRREEERRGEKRRGGNIRVGTQVSTDLGYPPFLRK